jgi:flagellar M-ring protein FliF
MAEEDNGRGAKFLQPLTSMAPHQMVISGLLAVASILAILGLWQWATAPSYQTLLVGEDPTVVSDSIAALEAAGIDYRVGAGGTMIEVVRSQVAEAEVSLATAGVSSSTIAGYELLDEQGFSASSFQQRINYQRALEGELTRTILDLDLVIAASVHLSIPEDELFSDEEEAPTASVVIDTSGSIGSRAVDGIINVVASAVPGMSPDGVTVADTSGRVLTDNGIDGSSESFLVRRSVEQQLETSAQTMLIAAFGQENALVRVSAELELDEAERETVTYDPESQVALREQSITEQYTGGSDAASGVVGVTDEVLDAATIADDSDSDYARNEQTSEFAVDRIRTVERNSSGDIVRLSVAVVVNDSVDPQPDLTQVSDIVAAAVGLDVTRGDVIAVESIPFDADFTETLEALPEAAEAATDPLAPIAPYLGIGQTALAILLLVVIVLSLRKGVKTLTNTVRQASVEVIDLDDIEKAALSEGGSTSSSSSSGKAEKQEANNGEPLALDRGPMSSNEVMRIIDQQPIEVASLLRTWADEAVSN